jgi:hypothetical protein
MVQAGKDPSRVCDDPHRVSKPLSVDGTSSRFVSSIMSSALLRIAAGLAACVLMFLVGTAYVFRLLTGIAQLTEPACADKVRMNESVIAG